MILYFLFAIVIQSDKERGCLWYSVSRDSFRDVRFELNYFTKSILVSSVVIFSQTSFADWAINFPTCWRVGGGGGVPLPHPIPLPVAPPLFLRPFLETVNVHFFPYLTFNISLCTSIFVVLTGNKYLQMYLSDYKDHQVRVVLVVWKYSTMDDGEQSVMIFGT